jgi:pimeloyl-ACP methyl ester carboxylesterase
MCIGSVPATGMRGPLLWRMANVGALRLADSPPRYETRSLSWCERSSPTTTTTMLIWEALDRFLRREMAQPSIDLCDGGRLIFVEDATHWVQHEEADRVNRLIVGFQRGRTIWYAAGNVSSGRIHRTSCC